MLLWLKTVSLLGHLVFQLSSQGCNFIYGQRTKGDQDGWIWKTTSEWNGLNKDEMFALTFTTFSMNKLIIALTVRRDCRSLEEDCTACWKLAASVLPPSARWARAGIGPEIKTDLPQVQAKRVTKVPFLSAQTAYELCHLSPRGQAHDWKRMTVRTAAPGADSACQGLWIQDSTNRCFWLWNPPL